MFFRNDGENNLVNHLFVLDDFDTSISIICFANGAM